MCKPLVSILIPCYNHEQFLTDCLESILAQDYENIELLICDDCSPDGSFEKILSYASRLRERFSRVEILRNETNQGVTKNINRMLTLAKGELIKTLASDDCLAPNAIGEMAVFLQENPETDVVVANGVTVLESEAYPRFTPQSKLYDTPPDFSGEDFYVRVARCNPISAPAAMVRKTVYDRFGLYDETLKVEDYEFWLRLLIEGNCRFGFLDKDLLFYRINANSMTSAVSNSGLERRRRLFHQSELDTLQKFRQAFAPEIYAELVLDRIHRERCTAINHKLWVWEAELRKSWKRFDGWNALSPSTGRKFRFAGLRQSIKKAITK